MAGSRGRRRFAASGLVLLLAAGCGAGREVTPGAVDAAQALWKKADVRDYNLEWASVGPRNVHYFAFVRGGEVQAIYSVLPDGRQVEAKPAVKRLYGVDGLFTVIRDELAEAGKPEPFGQARGTKVVLRFDPDPKFGYPRLYRRDVFGTPQGLAIDVVRFEPDPPSAIPPPST